MKRLMFFAVLMSVCSVCSLCWGASGTQTTTYSKWPAVTDITSYLGTTNAWVAMPTKTIISANYLGGQMYVLDSSGCVYTYDRESRTYTQKTAWGCGWSEITRVGGWAAHPDAEILLKPDTEGYCPNGLLRWYYALDGVLQVHQNFCARHIYSGINATLILEMYPSPTNGPISTQYNDGVTYHDVGQGFFAGYAGDGTACALKWDSVTAGHVTNVYTTTASGTMIVFPYQPPQFISKGFTGGFTGCVINDDIIMVTDGTTSYMYDRTLPVKTTWQKVTGAVSGLTGSSKGEMFGITSGNLRHLNVYAAYVSATLQSTYTGCPDDTHPCPPSGVTHTRTIQVKFPHGINGNLASFAGSPTATNQVTSWDAAPQCDLIFGDHGDPECFAPVNGGVNCSVVNNSIYTPLPPPMCHDTSCKAPEPAAVSHDARSFSPPYAEITRFQDAMQDGKYYAQAIAVCEAGVPACAPGTPPAPLVCGAETGVPPGQNPYFFETASCNDVAPFSKCSKTIVEDRAIGQCSFYKHAWGFIEFIARYDPNVANTCVPLPIVRHLAPPVNYPCHEELIP